MENYTKKKIALRYRILGISEIDQSFYKVAKAMNLAEKYHNGTRKDGSPEFSHQVQIVEHLMTMHRNLINPVAVLVAGFLHDTFEDYPESEKEIIKMFPEMADHIIRISKERYGNKITYEQYFGEMAECEVTSIVKLVDRIANISTMTGAFSSEKQLEYVEEVDKWFLPMLKKARRKFPEQELAYENLKSILVMQQQMIRDQHTNNS